MLVLDPPPVNGELALPSGAQPTAGISGALAGPDGQALARGEVYAVLRAGGEARRHVAATGVFRFESLPGGTYDLLVWSRGHRPQVVAEVALGEGEERELGTLRLAP